MSRRPDIALERDAERRAMIALVAVFALLVQALVPALASAAPLAGERLLICTPHGLQEAPAGDIQPEPACQHCVCPAMASSSAPTPNVASVRYAGERISPIAPRRVRLPPARAPPRPPGQGPPIQTA